MRAALEAWGTTTNLFQNGVASETNEPYIVTRTMAKPGVVLRRAVGSKGAFSEDVRIPKAFIARTKSRKKSPAKSTDLPPKAKDGKAERAAEAAAKKEREKQDRERVKREAVEEAERKSKEEAVAKAQTALNAATATHEAELGKIADARVALDRREEGENARWQEQKARLAKALDQAGK